MENIFENSFSLFNMDQSIEKILIPSAHPSIAVAQTRKSLGVWDIRTHRFIAALTSSAVGSQMGSAAVVHSSTIVMDTLVSRDGRWVVSVEGSQLLLWDMRTHGVVKRVTLQGVVYQLLPLMLEDESLVGCFSRHLDTTEQKTAKLRWALDGSFGGEKGDDKIFKI